MARARLFLQIVGAAAVLLGAPGLAGADPSAVFGRGDGKVLYRTVGIPDATDGTNGTAPAVPEPGAALLFVVGLGVVGARLRRR